MMIWQNLVCIINRGFLNVILLNLMWLIEILQLLKKKELFTNVMAPCGFVPRILEMKKIEFYNVRTGFVRILQMILPIILINLNAVLIIALIFLAQTIMV